VLVSHKDAQPVEEDAILIAANDVAAVPFVAHETSGWDKLYLRVRLKDVEDAGGDGGGSGLNWSHPVRIATSANMDHTTILGDLKEDTVPLQFVQEGVEYSVDLNIAAMPARRANLSLRHLVITCPILIHNKMGIPIDIIPTGDSHSKLASVWRPPGASLESVGLLGASTKAVENVRVVTQGRQSSNDVTLVLSATMQFPLVPTHLDKLVAATYEKKHGANDAGSKTLFTPKDGAVDVIGEWATLGERGAIYRSLTFKPLIQVRNTTACGMSIALDTTPVAGKAGSTWAVWVEAGGETAINMAASVAEQSTKNHWCLRLAAPARDSVPFEPYDRTAEAAVKFVEVRCPFFTMDSAVFGLAALGCGCGCGVESFR
jgi:hypothetical protein